MSATAVHLDHSALDASPAGPQIAQRHAKPLDPSRKFLTGPEVCARIGCERSTWAKWVKSGWAPARIPNVPGHPRWLVADIEDFERGRYGAGRLTGRRRQKRA